MFYNLSNLCNKQVTVSAGKFQTISVFYMVLQFLKHIPIRTSTGCWKANHRFCKPHCERQVLFIFCVGEFNVYLHLVEALRMQPAPTIWSIRWLFCLDYASHHRLHRYRVVIVVDFIVDDENEYEKIQIRYQFNVMHQEWKLSYGSYWYFRHVSFFPSFAHCTHGLGFNIVLVRPVLTGKISFVSASAHR